MAGRIKPLAPPSLDKRLPRSKRPVVEGKDPGYLAWLHQLPCVVSLRTDHIEAHHPTVGRGRMARKGDDSTALPINREYHSDQYPTGLHRGERAFWSAHGIDPTALADDLYAVYQAKRGPAVAREVIHLHRALAVVRLRAGVKIFEPLKGSVDA